MNGAVENSTESQIAMRDLSRLVQLKAVAKLVTRTSGPEDGQQTILESPIQTNLFRVYFE